LHSAEIREFDFQSKVMKDIVASALLSLGIQLWEKPAAGPKNIK
jgi:hypothetical protein